MLTLQLKTTRIILINNLNNLIQQLARQSTPCRAQGISCKCHQVYKSPYLFRGLFKLLYEKFDKLVRECQAVNSHLQICESSAIDFYTGTNQVLMSENPVSQCFLEIFLEGLKKVFHCYYKLKMIFYLLYLFIYLYDKIYQKEHFQFKKVSMPELF